MKYSIREYTKKKVAEKKDNAREMLETNNKACGLFRGQFRFFTRRNFIQRLSKKFQKTFRKIENSNIAKRAYKKIIYLYILETKEKKFL